MTPNRLHQIVTYRVDDVSYLLYMGLMQHAIGLIAGGFVGLRKRKKDLIFEVFLLLSGIARVLYLLGLGWVRRFKLKPIGGPRNLHVRGAGRLIERWLAGEWRRHAKAARHCWGEALF